MWLQWESCRISRYSFRLLAIVEQRAGVRISLIQSHPVRLGFRVRWTELIFSVRRPELTVARVYSWNGRCLTEDSKWWLNAISSLLKNVNMSPGAALLLPSSSSIQCHGALHLLSTNTDCKPILQLAGARFRHQRGITYLIVSWFCFSFRNFVLMYCIGLNFSTYVDRVRLDYVYREGMVYRREVANFAVFFSCEVCSGNYG